jgi:hypothetical protein
MHFLELKIPPVAILLICISALVSYQHRKPIFIERAIVHYVSRMAISSTPNNRQSNAT